MRRLLYIFLFVFLLSNCGKKKSDTFGDTEPLYIPEMVDTFSIDTIGIQKNINEIKDSPTKTTTPSRTRYKQKDNMRGFDPPSEDDMDDNGMTRYMEVNDDNGWE